MWPYWFLFALPAWLALTRLQPVQVQGTQWPGLWRAIFVFLVLMIGLRHQVGGDWVNYLEQIDFISGRSLGDSLSNTRNDISYTLLNWLAANAGLGGLYFADTVCAFIFSWGLFVFCRAQPRPWLALTVAVPYLVIVVAMGYTRQGVAIGLVMLGLVALSQASTARFILFVVLAGTFHKTAVVLMPLAILSNSKNKFLLVLWIGITSVLLYVLMLQDSISAFHANYIEAKYESSGAAIRVAMNAIPAIIFLKFRRRFEMPQSERMFWSWMSVGALAFVLLLAVSPSSTAVDRMALYWIPIQLVVLSRLPNAIGKHDGRNAKWVYAVVAYSAAVQFVWLFFSNYSFTWLPYQFYPWVALFK